MMGQGRKESVFKAAWGPVDFEKLGLHLKSCMSHFMFFPNPNPRKLQAKKMASHLHANNGTDVNKLAVLLFSLAEI